METPYYLPEEQCTAPAAECSAPAERSADGAELHPPLVIRGESPWTREDEDTGERGFLVPIGNRGQFRFIPQPSPDAHPYAAITDWLNFTFRIGPTNWHLETVFQGLFFALGGHFGPAIPRPSGMHRYEQSFDLGNTGARFACGGNNETALLSLSGEACSVVRDWPALIQWGRDNLKGKITRWDGAIDDYEGHHGIDEALAGYLRGDFGTGGRRPSMKQMGNWAAPDGSGRSIAIGKREHGKRLQVYEKGMQLGAKFHPWVRWEVSLGSTGRVIPWEVLLQPGSHAVGAFPRALSWAQFEASRIATIQKQAQLGYESLIDHASRQYGPLLSVMRHVEGSAEKVLQRLERESIPKRLQHPALPNPWEWLE
jgi:phage replication initiation protein